MTDSANGSRRQRVLVLHRKVTERCVMRIMKMFREVLTERVQEGFAFWSVDQR